MASGPPKFGDNRFAMLSDSPKKKKKRPFVKLQEEFPELPEKTKENPKFIIISSKDPKKKISEYSCFAVYRALNIISKEIVSISIKTKNVAEKFLKSKNFAGICEIECKLHESLNFVKGTIYAPFFVNVPDDEIVKELADQNVHSVFKFSRKVDGKLKPSGVRPVQLA